MAEGTLTTYVSGLAKYQYLFKVLAPYNDNTEQQVIPFPLPNQESEGNILFRFSGKTTSVDFEFVFVEESASYDASNGTAATYAPGVFPGDKVYTIADQKKWLRCYVFNAHFDTYWVLHVDGETYSVTDTYSPDARGAVTGLGFDRAPASPSFNTGHFKFIMGIVRQPA